MNVGMAAPVRDAESIGASQFRCESAGPADWLRLSRSHAPCCWVSCVSGRFVIAIMHMGLMVALIPTPQLCVVSASVAVSRLKIRPRYLEVDALTEPGRYMDVHLPEYIEEWVTRLSNVSFRSAFRRTMELERLRGRPHSRLASLIV